MNGSKMSPETRFGKFELLQQLGEGAHSTVYRARADGESEEVALKVMKQELSYADARLGRFGAEKLATGLSHPNICKVLSGGRESNYAYIVMELLDGKTLAQVLAQRWRLEAPEAVAIAVQVADALAYAHGQNLIHRDIKPDNVMVGPSNVVKVLDFGLARLGASAQDSQVQGTPAYMSPEQAGGQAVDQRSDVYSLGAVLYHSLAGRPPYEGPDVAGLLKEVASHPPPSLAGLAPHAPRPLVKVVEQAMARNLDKRTGSAAALAAALRAVSTGGAAAAAGAAAGVPKWAVGAGVLALLLAAAAAARLAGLF
jgi:serine/threonine protein kinase